ncbi:MAG: hypothetical protein ACKVP0_25145 [Pirellulaceae bacterium]
MTAKNWNLSRRDLLAAGSSTAVMGLLGGNFLHADEPKSAPGKKLRVAAVNSIFRLRSHAYHIVGRFVHGYRKDGFHHQPPFEVVRMFDDQAPADDLGPAFCKTHGIELCKTVAETLGGDKLEVDAVLLIIEHGDYKTNELGQILYPRYERFQEIVEVFRKSGRAVPVFVDKHLSYDHKRAAEMVATADKLGFGMMAGSSLPVTWRHPEIEPPVGTPFTEGLACYGFDRGAQEIYFIHGLETLQCMLERRAGGETGVKSVVLLAGDAVWKAGDAGRWSWKLLEAALSRCPSHNVGPIRENVLNPRAILIEYADGTKGTVLNLIEQVSDFAFAGSVKGVKEPISSCFYLPAPPGARFFDPLTWNIEQFFLSGGKAPYPVQRTLLTSTILDLALHSLKDSSKPVSSPALKIAYQAPKNSGFFRGPIVDNP